MKVTVKVEGLREVQDALRELPAATAKNVLRRVLRARAEPIAEAARRLAPVDDGELRDSIAVSTKLTRRQRGLHRKDGPNDVEVYVGPSALPQAHLREFGGDKAAPKPFMRPAWDTLKMGVLDGIKEDLWAEIAKAAKRLARKAARAAAKRGG